MPIFGDLGIRSWVNGPIPFSPDAEPVMGLTEDLDNLFHCCGFSAGIAAAGGAGEAMANWIVDDDPGLDLWPFDVRRFGAPHNVPAVLELLSVASYGHYYDIAYPNRPALPPRGQRRSAIHDRLGDRGAVFASRFGYERPDWFATGGADPAETPTFGRSAAWPFVEAEHRAVRETVGIVDQSSLAEFRIRGRNALATLQTVAGAELDTADGTVVHTPLLNARGGIEADVTVTRLGAAEFSLVTGAGFGRHDLAFLLQNTPDDGSVTIDDVTSAFGVLTVCGPRSRELLQTVSGADFSDAFGAMTARDVDLGWAPARALRVTGTGELGWQLHIPTEYVADAYDKLVAAGATFGLRDVGHRALESLRLEAQHLSWSVDVTADTNPYEAGTGSLVDATKPTLLAGPALRAVVENGPRRKLCWFSTTADVTMHGGELLAHPASGFEVGVASAGFGHTVRRTLFSAYLPVEIASANRFEVEGAQPPFPRHPPRRAAVRPEGPLLRPTGVPESPIRSACDRSVILVAQPAAARTMSTAAAMTSSSGGAPCIIAAFSTAPDSIRMAASSFGPCSAGARSPRSTRSPFRTTSSRTSFSSGCEAASSASAASARSMRRSSITERNVVSSPIRSVRTSPVGVW